MLVTSKGNKHLHSLPTSIIIVNAEIPFKPSVKNLGFAIDCHLAMNAHFPTMLGHAAIDCVFWHLLIDS